MRLRISVCFHVSHCLCPLSQKSKIFASFFKVCLPPASIRLKDSLRSAALPKGEPSGVRTVGDAGPYNAFSVARTVGDAGPYNVFWAVRYDLEFVIRNL